MIDPRVASGLRDLLPAVMIPRDRILKTFRETFASFGFVPIETPHIERMEVLTGKGAGSDEVLRQIFDVTNKGGTPGELALRFDLTVPLARFIARHMDEVGVPFKRYAIGSVFRGERPAKGRFREFVQCDFDTIGVDSRLADAETAQLIYSALTAADVPPFTITLNNRKILDGMLESVDLAGKTGLVLRSLDKLSKIGRDGVAAELERTADAGGAGLNADQTARILEFAETGRGPAELMLILRGIAQGASTARMARELGCDRMKLLQLRHKLQEHATAGLDPAVLPDATVEADECYVNAGEKRHPAPRPRRPAAASGQQATGPRHLR